MNWKRNNGTYRIATNEGWSNKTGSNYLCYPFMINRSYNNSNRWALTHIACGREIGNFRLLEHAKACAKDLSVFDCWYLPTSDMLISSMESNGEKSAIMDLVATHRQK